MTAGRPGAGLLAAVPVTLIVFDVLQSGRDHLASSPYVLRRALLDDLGLPVPGAVQVPPAFPGEGSGLSMAELRELTALLQSLEQPVSPFTGPLPPAITRHARWEPASPVFCRSLRIWPLMSGWV
jgi:hypothetical protein